jgi:hypothetical protein
MAASKAVAKRGAASSRLPRGVSSKVRRDRKQFLPRELMIVINEVL